MVLIETQIVAFPDKEISRIVNSIPGFVIRLEAEHKGNKGSRFRLILGRSPEGHSSIPHHGSEIAF